MSTKEADSSLHQSASLYVGDLHPLVTEAFLFEIFKAVGPVASIRVCRDNITRRSLGYAYVNFHTQDDASRAREVLNNSTIKGKQIRIMWSHRDPSKRKSGTGNIFIKNLDKSIDNKALYDTFSTFGNILSCKVARNKEGESKGHGYVHYETEEAAAEAIAKVNGMILNGKLVFVGPFIPNSKRVPASDPDQFTNVYVKHFPVEWDEEGLEKAMAAYGAIKSLSIAKEDGKSKGFGFVNFEKHEEAMQCVEELHGKKKFDESCKLEAYVQRHMKKDERKKFLNETQDQGINLYIKNLDDTVDEAKLTEVFTPFGDISSCAIMRDENGNSKGFGFVCFTTPEDASKAVTQMHSSMLAGKPLYVAIAERRDVRRARLQAQNAARNAMRMANQGAMGGAPVYPAVFYPPQQQRTFVYGHQPIMRRWPSGAQPRQNFRGPVRGNGFVVPMAQRGGARGKRVVRGFSGNPRAAAAASGGGRGSEIPTANSILTSGSVEDQKRTIGEALFPRVRAIDQDNCSKLTGMFVESLSVPELMQLLESPEALRQSVKEGLAVLAEHAASAAETTEEADETD